MSKKADYEYQIKVNRKGGIKFGITTLVMVSLVAIITLSGVLFMYIMANEDTMEQLELERKRVENLTKINSDYVNEITSLSDRITELKKTPVDTSGDAILERDIFIYIDKKFQIIPKTAAVDIANQIVVQSRRHGVAPELVVGIIQVESAFNASAISKANARGLMQVMPEWAPKFGLEKVSDLHDIDTGIESGIKVLKIHVEEEKGNLTKGLYKYVGGSDAYAGKVYKAIGTFVAYRSSIQSVEEEKEDSESIAGATADNK